MRSSSNIGNFITPRLINDKNSHNFPGKGYNITFQIEQLIFV